MISVRLPVAGIDVVIQLPTGAEDILLLESGAPDFAVALALLGRVVRRADGEPIDWDTLSITDVDVLLLRLRQRVIGDVVNADVRCPAPSCHARVDITFSIQHFLQHHQPRRTPGLSPAKEHGWFRLATGDLEFRVPRASDQIAIALATQPAQALQERCLRPATVPARVRRRVETAMEAIAPSLFAELQGECPDCGETVTCYFDPLQYSLRELRDRGAFVYEDVSKIAGYTHWSETNILALPSARRVRYAELAPSERTTA